MRKTTMPLRSKLQNTPLTGALVLLILVELCLFYSESSYSYTNHETRKVFVLGIRGNEVATQKFISRNSSPAVLVEKLTTETKEFRNGDTFVRLKGSVIAEEVHIVLPESFTPNTLMEALIKTHTVYQSGAAKIVIHSPESLHELTVYDESFDSNTLNINAHGLFRTAGADVVAIGPTGASEVSIDDIVKPKRHRLVRNAYALGGTHQNFAAQMAKELGIQLVTEMDSIEPDSLVFYFMSTSSTNANLLRALKDIAALRQLGATVALVSPYLPYARSDKIDQEGISVTGRLVADLIQSAGANSIAFVRAHAAQSEGFFNIPTFHAFGRETINEFIKEQDIEVVASPDTGATKETVRHAMELGLPLAVVAKYRDPISGELSIKGVSSDVVLEGKVVALIDDETASGGTLAEDAEYLVKKHGVKKAYGIVTALSGDAKEAIESPYLDVVVVSDSVPVPDETKPLVKTTSVVRELANRVKPLLKYVSAKSCDDTFRK